MSDLIVNLNVNKKSDKRPEMGNSFGAYTDPNGLHAKSILKPDVYTHPYDLNSIKNRTLSATKSEMESKGLRSEKHLSNVTLINNVDHKRMVTEAALQAASLQAITAWAELCWRIKRAYRIAAQEMTDLSLADELGAYAKKLGETLWRDDWQQLLLKLQVLLREMAVEQRERLRRAANTQATTKPDEYIKALLQGHKAFCAAGDALAPVLPNQVDKLLAKRFAPADFKLLNSRMFESCVYSDPVIQDSVPAAIGRVAGNDRQLVRSYLALDEQMTDVASRWLDVKKLILKLGKGRAQLLDDWKACKELREIASETNWRIRKKPPTISSLPDFDVQLMTLADELSTDRSCACSADTLPDTPPLSPDQPDLLKLVSKTSKLLSPVRTNQKRPQDKKLTTNTNTTTTTTKGKISTNQSQQVNKENQVPKNINTKTGIVNLNGGVVPQQKCDHNKREIQQPIKKKVEEKCTEKTHCEQPKSQSGSGSAPNLAHKKSGTCQCECPHGEEDPRQINKFNKLRDRLRTRLKEKEKQKTTTKMEGSSSTEKSNDDRDIAQLLNFIEGTDTLDPIKAQKNAARKLRRQERKLEAERQRLEEERRKEEEERQRVAQERLRLEQEALAKAAEAKAQARLAKKEKNENENGKKPGPMVTIKRVMQGSNKEPTVTITLKGSTPDKDKLLFTLINGQTENKPSTEANKVDLSQLNPSQLSKKQRKKLKKEQAKNAQQQHQQQQAIQNQMKIENKVEKENSNNNKSSNKKTKSNNSNNKPAVSNHSKQSSGSDNPKATGDKVKSNGNGNSSTKEVPNVNSNLNSNSNSNSNNSSVKVSLNNKTDSSVLNLQMLKLPPGITITKVEGPSADRKIQLNAKTASNNPNSNANSNNRNSSTPPPVQQSPAPVQSSDNRSGIIVVDTVKLKQDLPSSAENSSQRSKKNKKKKNKKQKEPEKSQEKNEEEVVKITNTNTSDGSNMFTLKNPMFYPAMNETQEKQGMNNTQASIIKGANGMVTIRSPRLGACNGSGAIPFMSLQAVASGDVKPSHILGELKPVVQAQNTAQPTPINTSNSVAENKPFDAQQILSGLPGIEITKINKGSAKPRNEKAAFQPADVSIIPTNMASNGDVYKLFYDNADWSLESVFAPKDIKEDEILDADELELEAFKRFCQQSVPPERKEKVAYLNVKDIILKKKASEKC